MLQNLRLNDPTDELSDSQMFPYRNLNHLMIVVLKVTSHSRFFFAQPDIEVGAKRSNQRKTPTSRKPGPRTRKTPGQRKTIYNTGYLASVDYRFIPSDKPILVTGNGSLELSLVGIWLGIQLF